MNLICPHCKSVAPRPADILARETACPACGRVIRLDEFPTLAAQPAGDTPSSGSLAGNLLGGCRLVRLIGRGGMGEVYEAVQESLNRKVAVKVLPQRLAADEAFVKRFNRESGALAQLSHPNIVVIYDRGHEGQHYYFVLEYVEGADGGPAGTLHRRLRSETPVAITECARLIQQLVEALAYAHGKGVIHRDIKPSNVVLDGRGHARLVDFGLAQMVGVNTAEGTRLTLSGEVLGTAGYVAPEQREGNRQADARVDIYSCGVLLYEMLTGRMPEGAFELPSELVAGLDPAWDAVAEKALQRNPDRRYQTAGEFLDAIRSAAAGQSTVPPVARPPKIPVQPSRRSDTTSSRLTPIVGKCVKCQTVNPGDNRYCTECGANLYETCLACKGENRVGTKYCGQCGVDLTKLKRIAEHRREVTDLLSQIGSVSREEAKALLQKAYDVLSRLLADAPADADGQRLMTEVDARRRDLVLGEAQELFAQAKKQSGSIPLLTQGYATLAKALGEYPQDGTIAEKLKEVKAELRKVFLDRVARAANDCEAMSLLQQMVQLLPEDTEVAARLDRLRTEFADMKHRIQNRLKDGRFTEALEELITARDRFLEDKELAAMRIAAEEGQRKLLELVQSEIPTLWERRQLVQLLDKLNEVSKVTTEVPGLEEARQQATAALSEARQNCFKGDALLAAGEPQEALSCYERAASLCTDLAHAMSGMAEGRRRVETARWEQKAREEVKRREAEERLLAWVIGVFALVLLAWAGWYWGISLPKQRRVEAEEARKATVARNAETARQEAERKRQEQLAAQQAEAARKAEEKRQHEELTRKEAARKQLADATKETPWENSLGMKFVPVAGTAVLFGVWDVRVRDYRAYASAAGGVANSWQKPGFTQGEDHPVVNVSLEEAQAFCAWLTQKERREGKLSEQQSYRLPREEEWNRAVGNGKYPWGDQWPPPTGAGNYHAILGADNYVNTSPVASFKANEYGLYDMGGNVWQWCYDTEKNGCGLRGASWNYYYPDYLLSSFRTYYPPGYRLDGVGFRCVLAVEAEPKRQQEEPTRKEAAVNPANATKETPWENSLGMKFVPVRGAEVLFCVWETRVKDYATFASAKSGVDGSWKDPVFEGQKVTATADCPVVNVSWDDAKAFCEWLTKRERAAGKLSDSQSYRLPQDWEWSVAVGLSESRSRTPQEKDAKTPDVYPWGSGYPPRGRVGNYADATAKQAFSGFTVIEGYDDGYAATAPVGSFAANRYGLYDLGGNAWEWCGDYYDGQSGSRVLRGGSWNVSGSRYLLSSHRLSNAAEYRSNRIGFRCGLVVGSAAR